MKIFSALLISTLLLFGLSANAQSISIHNLEDEVKHSLHSSNSYRKMNIELTNKTYDDINLDIPCGTYFNNGHSNEQNLVVIFKEEFDLGSKEKRSFNLITACMDASKQAPTSHYDWTLKNDKALGDLIRFYHANRSIVSFMTNPDFHSTKEKQANFLQMSVWAYFNADRKHILNFASKYMFDNDKEEAEEFVDMTLPLIQIFLEYYKSINR